MKRIFLLGDSFTDNIYRDCIDNDINNLNNPISYYLYMLKKNNKPYPLYFCDYLKNWGYDVYNFGNGGCSLLDIFLSFSKIDKEFIEGDRIIINWTAVSRFNWLDDTDYNIKIHAGDINFVKSPELKSFFQDHALNRQYSLDNNGYIKQVWIPFMEYLVNLHYKYKPIVWSPFRDLSNIFSDKKWYFYEPDNKVFEEIIPHYDKLRIFQDMKNLNSGYDVLNKIQDHHYSRYGNYYLAIILNSILENSENEYYIKDEKLFKKIVFDIMNNKFPD